MPRSHLARLRVLATCGLIGSGPASAALEGHVIGAQYLFDSIASVFADLGTATVGSAVEFQVFSILADVGDGQIRLDRPGGIEFAPGSFNGWRFHDALGAMPAITSVTVNAATRIEGFDASRISFDADNIWLNFASLGNSEVFYAVVDVRLVPEPASWAMFAAGLLALGTAARRRVT
jgi:hypothetical protein